MKPLDLELKGPREIGQLRLVMEDLSQESFAHQCRDGPQLTVQLTPLHDNLVRTLRNAIGKDTP